MPKITVQEHKDLTLLPPDSIVHLKIDELTTREMDGRNGKWEKLEFKFKILGVQAVGDGSSPEDYADVIGSPIWGSVRYVLTESPENRLRQWAEAILGIEMGVGFELDTDLLLNRECRGLTIQYAKRTTNPATGQPFMGHQIDSLLPKANQFGQPQQQFAQQPPQQQWGQQPAQQQWGQPQQQQQGSWNQPAQQAPVQDPWAVPAQQQQQPAQQYQQQQYQQPASDPWAQTPAGEEPPF